MDQTRTNLATYSLNVNGRTVQVAAEPDTPLPWVLRDALTLLGTRFGCGGGWCGACTVHLDGEPRRSCMTSIQNVGTARVTTIEGLSSDGRHPVQLAWNDLDVAQCGYCQAGQIMTAAALLARTPNPDDQDVIAAMNGNLCRCGIWCAQPDMGEGTRTGGLQGTRCACRRVGRWRNRRREQRDIDRSGEDVAREAAADDLLGIRRTASV